MARREARQSERILKILNTCFDSTRKKQRRGALSQFDERRLERLIRRRAVAFRRWTARHDKNLRETARMMCISRRTLVRWESDWNALRLPPHTLGRPAERSSPQKRKEIFHLLNTLGPHTGVPSLRAKYPELARGELAHLLWKYRKLHARGQDLIINTLRWKRPGAVWAMDFHQPPLSVDGIYPYILMVRDMASGCYLLWLPVRKATAKAAADALKFLFAAYGIPLAPFAG
jgi:hypothetical protein